MKHVNQLVGPYTSIVNTIYRLLLLQIYWLLFTLLGLVVWGILPATYALIVCMRDENQLDARRMFQKFWLSYKKNWKKFISAASVWYVMFILMSINIIIIQHEVILILVLGTIIYMALAFIYFLLKYESTISLGRQIYYSFAYTFLFPKNNIIILVCLFSLYVGIQYVPGIIFFFGISVLMLCFSKLDLQLSSK